MIWYYFHLQNYKCTENGFWWIYFRKYSNFRKRTIVTGSWLWNEKKNISCLSWLVGWFHFVFATICFFSFKFNRISVDVKHLRQKRINNKDIAWRRHEINTLYETCTLVDFSAYATYSYIYVKIYRNKRAPFYMQKSLFFSTEFLTVLFTIARIILFNGQRSFFSLYLCFCTWESVNVCVCIT